MRRLMVTEEVFNLFLSSKKPNERESDSIKRLIEDALKWEAKPKEYMTIEEAAALLHISVGSVYRMTSRGTIPYRKPHKKLLFDREELQKFIESKRHMTHEEELDWAARIITR